MLFAWTPGCSSLGIKTSLLWWGQLSLSNYSHKYASDTRLYISSSARFLDFLFSQQTSTFKCFPNTTNWTCPNKTLLLPPKMFLRWRHWKGVTTGFPSYSSRSQWIVRLCASTWGQRWVESFWISRRLCTGSSCALSCFFPGVYFLYFSGWFKH